MENHQLERLRFYTEKRMQTIMIGAISKFEENFGYLWGQNVPEDQELSAQQLDFLNHWERTRNQILNQGNNQIRNNKDDFLKWGGAFRQSYHYNFGKPCGDTCKKNNKTTND